MSFTSLPFFLLLSLVLALYWILQGRTRWQNLLLLAASYVFYGWWDWRFLGLILFTTLSSFGCALGMEKFGSLKGSKGSNGLKGSKGLKGLKGLSDLKGSNGASWLNAINIVINLGILALFKYYDFFASSLNDALTGLGIEASWPLLHLVLPVGISFYTFQSLSYTIDVRRGSLQATHSLLDYATYIAFFPQLVAGPIERATRLLPQFASQRTFSNREAAEGCRLMLWGFFKKLVIADNCAITVEQVFHNYQHLGTLTLLFGAVLFAFQIYADFSGYSDIAIGTAHLFGIRLSPNFDRPYLATTIPDFWRRWHISLTSWFRDYVYFPLGGSRVSRLRTFLNTLVVFSLSGLWHGANWTFVAWGFYHGALFFPYNMRWLPGRSEADSSRLRAMVWGQRAIVFLLICLGWVLFRAESISMALTYLHRLLCTFDFSLPPYSKSILLYALPMLWFEAKHCPWPHRTWLRWLCYYALIALILWKGTDGGHFIYFQF